MPNDSDWTLPPGLRVESPFPDHAWPLAWEWMQPFKRRVADDFSPRTADQFVAGQIEASARPGRKSWGVWRDGRIGGLVTLDRLDDRQISGWTHVLFRQDFFGWPVTLPALRRIYREAFDLGVEMLRSEVFADNDGVRSLARKLGFVEYGLGRPGKSGKVDPIPAVTVRNGEPAAMIGLVLTKEAFDANWTGGGAVARWSVGGRVGGGVGARKAQADADLDDGTDSEPGATPVERGAGDAARK